MDWTLQKIELENFKFFKEPFELPVGGKHVLLYGENGSGKSSIVWGLYTLMESRKKQVADVQKYFNPADDQHLRNRYSQPLDYACVKITFNPLVAGRLPKNYEISTTTINTQTPADDFMKFTTAAFDMFNYRMLSEWIYRKNSSRIDLFKGFEKDIFKSLYFNSSYSRVDGTSSAPNGKTAEEWWRYIKSVRLPQTQQGQVRKSAPEYAEFMKLLDNFKTEMDAMLLQVERSANTMLHQDLGLQDINIEIGMTPIPFNLIKPHCRTQRDGVVHNPVISVKAHVVDSNVPGWGTDVEHLATYFNESKMTCIGIALRLALSDYKLIVRGNVSPILCIDDLLLSLDMSARIPIIKLLLKKAQDRQLLIFTHDRSFFETMQMMIRERRLEGGWFFYEMLERKSTTPGVPPKPLFYHTKSYRDKAEYHFEQGDYPAAANYLRKYCEEQLKRLLPNNLQLISKPKGEVERADLNGLISKMGSDFCSLYNIAQTNLPSLSVYRKRLMNPMSHDDAHTPVYKAEVIDAMAEIDKLKVIADSLGVICKGEGRREDDFKMYIVNGSNSEVVEFTVMENWTRIDVSGLRYFKDVKVRVTSTTSAAVALQEYESLRQVFGIVCTALGLTVAPAFESTITNNHTGTALTLL